jgi:hypothetical protein
MNSFELDAKVSREQYNDRLVEARIRRLIREAQAVQRPTPPPVRPESLLRRVAAALNIHPVVGAKRRQIPHTALRR